MKKLLNNNALKIIAVISMFVDHLGFIIFPNAIFLRVIGRVAFPIFAFCVAEGLHYTKSRKKYVLTLLLFALISQIPYYFIFNTFFKFNVLFTFLIAIIVIFLIEQYSKSLKESKTFISIGYLLLLLIILFGLVIITPFRMLEYDIFGVATVMIFYFLREKSLWKYLLFALTMILLTLFGAYLSNEFIFATTYQFFSILAIIPLLLYNSSRGKLNLKYFFYIFYPTHLMLLWLIGRFL